MLLAHASATVPGDALVGVAAVAAVLTFARSGAGGLRLLAFASGVAALALALAPSVEVRAAASFTAHMAQHLALTVVAAPLIVLARPVPALARALPPLAPAMARLRRLAGGGGGRRAVARATAWLVAFVATFWAWHEPAAYEAALRNDVLHGMQHACYVVTSLGFWSYTVGAAGRTSPLLAGALLAAAMAQGTLGTLVFAFATQVYYPSYASNGLGDVQAGGALMAAGGVVYVLAAVAVSSAWLAGLERTAPAEGAAPRTGAAPTG